MPERSHSTLREGIVVGLIGAAVVALYYGVIDLAGGRRLYTPVLIARVLFGVSPGEAASFGMIALVTLIHVSIFALMGIGLTGLIHLATRNPVWRMGALIGFVVTAGFIAGLAYALGPASGERFPEWEVIGGGILGVAAMVIYLRRNHAGLLNAFREIPLGDETESPPHAPGASRADLRS